MFRIRKVFSFCASHRLDPAPVGSACAQIHGHNFVVELELSSPTLDEYGFVREFRELDQFKNYLDGTLDHRHLNDVLPFNPTTENLTRHLFHVAKTMFPELSCVRVSETPKTWIEYSMDGENR